MSTGAVQRWLKFGEYPTDTLEKELKTATDSRIERGDFAHRDIEYIRHLHLRFLDRENDIDDALLEKIRHLCRVWDLRIGAMNVTSHRKYLGPFIVAAKKLVIPLVRLALADVIKQQREFNGVAISVLSELSARKNSPSNGRE